MDDLISSSLSRIRNTATQLFGTVQNDVNTLGQNINLVKTNPQFAQQLPGMVNQGIRQGVNQIMGSNPVSNVLGSAVGGLEQGFTGGLTAKYQTNRPYIERFGQALGGVGAAAMPVQSVAMGAFNPVISTGQTILNQGRLPTGSELNDSFNQGVVQGTQFAPLGAVANVALNPLTAKMGTSALAKIASAGINTGVGNAAYSALQPAQNISERAQNTVSGFAQGAALGAGGQAVSMIPGAVAKGFHAMNQKASDFAQANPATGGATIDSNNPVIAKFKDVGYKGLNPQEKAVINSMDLESIRGLNPQATLGDLQEIHQAKAGLPLLANLDQATKTNNPELTFQIAQQIVSDPKYAAYKPGIESLIAGMQSTQTGAFNPNAKIVNPLNDERLAQVENRIKAIKPDANIAGVRPRVDTASGFITTDGTFSAVNTGHSTSLGDLGAGEKGLNDYLDSGGIRTFVNGEGGDINIEIHKPPTPEQMQVLQSLPTDRKYYFDINDITQIGDQAKRIGTSKADFFQALQKAFSNQVESNPSQSGGVNLGADITNPFSKNKPNPQDVAQALHAGQITNEEANTLLGNKNIEQPITQGLEPGKNVGNIYEKNVGGELENQGYQVNYNGAAQGVKDNGIDLIAQKDGQTLLIQNKYRPDLSTIHDGTLTSFIQGIFDYRTKNPGENITPVLYTNVDLDPAAEQMARDNNIQVLKADLYGNMKGGQVGYTAPDDVTGKPRSFLQTVQNSPGQKEDVTAAAGNIQPQVYTPKTNPDAFAAAQDYINSQGIDQAHAYVLSDMPASAEKAGMGQILMQKYADNIDQGDNYQKFQELTDSMDTQARSQGQAIQMLSNWDKLSPKSLLNVANATAEQIKQPLSDDFQKSIITRAGDIQKMAEGSPERTQATQALLQDIAGQLPVSKWDLFKSYRYQNMLSNPITLTKIAYSNITNGLIVRPIDMFATATRESVSSIMDSDYQRTVYYSDIPTWYKNVLIGLPQAWKAASYGFSTNNIDQAFSDDTAAQTTIQMLRKSNTPDALTFFPKLHSFIYKYAQSVVSGAEYARLMNTGNYTDEEAMAKANLLGDKLSLRAPLGQTTSADSAAVRAVDSLGNIVSKSSHLPGIGWAQSWIAPFMRVSSNWTKLAVEHSPLSLPDSTVKMMQGVPGADVAFDHAMVGSVVAGIGALLATQGRITLAAPVDPKSNELFFASGRKPYSVNIGGDWVPMQYFGAFGLSLMLPQAIKDAVTGPNATKDMFSKFQVAADNVTRMSIASTPLPTLTQFLDMLNGSAQVNPSTIAAGLAGQVIPLDAMLRYISSVVDPVYRKATTFSQRMESSIPGMTQNLPAYTTPLGQSETRNVSNYIAPYAIGEGNNQFENLYKGRQSTLDSNAILNQANKDLQTGGAANLGGNEVSPGFYKLPNGSFAYESTDAGGNPIITKVALKDLNPGTDAQTPSGLKQQANAVSNAQGLVAKSDLLDPKSKLPISQALQMIQQAGGDSTGAYWGAIRALPSTQQAEFVHSYLKDQTNGDLNSRLSNMIQSQVLTPGVTAEMNRLGLISPDLKKELDGAIKNDLYQTGGVINPSSVSLPGVLAKQMATQSMVYGGMGGQGTTPVIPQIGYGAPGGGGKPINGAKRILTSMRSSLTRNAQKRYVKARADKAKTVKTKLAQTRFPTTSIKPTNAKLAIPGKQKVTRIKLARGNTQKFKVKNGLIT